MVMAAIVVVADARRFGLSSATWAHWEPFHRASERGQVVGAARATTGPPISGRAWTNATTHFTLDSVLDHAAPAGSSDATWRQRFYVDQTFWAGDGAPVFLYIGGEGPQGPVAPSLFMYELARTHGALMIALEHRFYGASVPVDDMSTANLRYLTSEQALGDLAQFRVHVGSLHAGVPDGQSSPPVTLQHSPAGAKWVAFGGSYPGMLSAWVKTKYPALFAGSVASSAPVQPEFDFEQYNQVVGNALANPGVGGSAACLAAISKGVLAVVAAVAALPSTPKLPPKLMPCNSVAGELDRVVYYSSILSPFQGFVQYNTLGANGAVSHVCALALSKPDPLAGLAAAIAPGVGRCLQANWTKDTVAPLRNTAFDGESMMRQWVWQSCNEFGFFATTTGAGQPFLPFGIGVADVGKRLCEQVFGLENYTGPNTGWAATNYGGRAIGATNVTFPNGSADPWHALGVVNATDPFFNACTEGEPSCTEQAVGADDRVVFIKDTSHCRDMYAPGAGGLHDTDAVVWAHANIAAKVAGYLQ